MKPRAVIIFAISVAVFTLAATHRFHDSAHAIGMLKKGGGLVRHPVRLDGEKPSASLIVTARVVPPYRGDARVVLEGAPGYSYAIHNAEPAIRLPFHHRPTFRDNVYHNLRPNDKVALWVIMHHRGTVPTAPQRHPDGDSSESCCEQAGASGEPGKKDRQGFGRKGPLLAFYDIRSNERLLTVPISFIGTEGDRHGE
jgi:hypothetical protein